MPFQYIYLCYLAKYNLLHIFFDVHYVRTKVRIGTATYLYDFL